MGLPTLVNLTRESLKDMPRDSKSQQVGNQEDHHRTCEHMDRLEPHLQEWDGEPTSLLDRGRVQHLAWKTPSTMMVMDLTSDHPSMCPRTNRGNL